MLYNMPITFASIYQIFKIARAKNGKIRIQIQKKKNYEFKYAIIFISAQKKYVTYFFSHFHFSVNCEGGT